MPVTAEVKSIWNVTCDMDDCDAQMLSLVIRNIDKVKYRVHLPVWKTKILNKNANNWGKLI